jgi:hypothetical protein
LREAPPPPASLHDDIRTMMKSLVAVPSCLLLAAVLSQESLAKQPIATTLRASTTSRRCQQTTTAFVTSPRSFLSSPPITRDVKLNASKKKSKPKKSNTSNKTGGGFGTSSSTATKPKKSVDNSIQYPELEPQVRQTLLPSPNINFINNEDSGTVLAEEMYDRLEDIYGLEKFNFGGVGAIYKSIGVVVGNEEKEVEEVEGGGGGSSPSSSLFDDILSGGGSSSTTSSLSGGSSDPLEQLFGPAPAPSSDSNTEESKTAAFDLNILPPFEKFRVLHTDPMVLSIDDFFTNEECDRYVQMSIDAEKQQTGAEGETTNEEGSDISSLQPLLLGQSQTVGKDSRSKAQRTSTTWFHHYQGVPELMAKASRLLGLEGIDRFEEPQTVRYRRNEKFTWHLDALSPEEVNNPSGSGQRIATLLVYLTDVASGSGGATMFRDLGNQNDGEPLKVRPKKGSALLFFPSAGGIPGCPFDIRTLHCGEAVAEDAESEKWIAQLWLRQRRYEPTAPVGNRHEDAFAEIKRYCESTQG